MVRSVLMSGGSALEEQHMNIVPDILNCFCNVVIGRMLPYSGLLPVSHTTRYCEKTNSRVLDKDKFICEWSGFGSNMYFVLHNMHMNVHRIG